MRSLVVVVSFLLVVAELSRQLGCLVREIVELGRFAFWPGVVAPRLIANARMFGVRHGAHALECRPALFAAITCSCRNVSRLMAMILTALSPCLSVCATGHVCTDLLRPRPCPIPLASRVQRLPLSAQRTPAHVG